MVNWCSEFNEWVHWVCWVGLVIGYGGKEGGYVNELLLAVVCVCVSCVLTVCLTALYVC